MIDKLPLITIGITCYNAQTSIARAIESALAQDWPNFEIIVVDDCSTDNSVSIVEKHKTVHLIQHEINQGPAGARQTILDNAKGQYIAFFDDDDSSHPNRLTAQYERITQYAQQAQKDLIACYASGERIYENGYKVQLDAIGSKADVPVGQAVANRYLFFASSPKLFFGTGTPSCSLMVRTDILKEAGGFDSNFRRVEDVDFAIRLALKGGHFIGCSENLFTQYATIGADKSPEKNKDAEIQLAEKHKNYLKSVGRYYYAKTWPLLRYYHFKGQYAHLGWTLAKLLVRHPVKTSQHFFTTAPKRFMHERRMKKKNSPS